MKKTSNSGSIFNSDGSLNTESVIKDGKVNEEKSSHGLVIAMSAVAAVIVGLVICIIIIRNSNGDLEMTKEPEEGLEITSVMATTGTSDNALPNSDTSYLASEPSFEMSILSSEAQNLSEGGIVVIDETQSEDTSVIVADENNEKNDSADASLKDTPKEPSDETEIAANETPLAQNYSLADTTTVNSYSGLVLESGSIITGLDLVNFINGNPSYLSYVNNTISNDAMSFVNGGASLSDVPATAKFKVEVTDNGYVFTQIEG